MFLWSSLVTGPSFMSISFTGSGVMTIFFYKRSTKNLKIGNTAIWVFSDIWRLRRVMYTKIDTNIFNEMLLNDAKCQGYSFYRF